MDKSENSAYHYMQLFYRTGEPVFYLLAKREETSGQG